MIGSVALLINNITGGSMVVLPLTYQTSGWVLTTLALLGIAGLSTISSIMIIEAMNMIPGNHKFHKRMEYTNLADEYFPRWLYWITQFMYQLSIMAQNISMIVQSCQVMDFTLVALLGLSCALPQFSPNVAFTCSYPGGFTLNGNSPFGNWYLISLGFIITCCAVMPLGFIDLDDNDVVQKGGFFALVLIIIVWLGISVNNNPTLPYVPAIGCDFSQLMGSVLFNFAIVYTIPSWINEKKNSVSIVKALLISSFGAATIFALLGIAGGGGFPPPQNNETLLNQIYSLNTKIASITFYLFPACVNLTSIPVNSIVQRYNLREAGVCGPKQAAFWGVVFPWICSIPLYTGNGYQNLVNWSGVFLISTVNFILPPVMYLIAYKKYGSKSGRIRTQYEIEASMKKKESEDMLKPNDEILTINNNSDNLHDKNETNEIKSVNVNAKVINVTHKNKDKDKDAANIDQSNIDVANIDRPILDSKTPSLVAYPSIKKTTSSSKQVASVPANEFIVSPSFVDPNDANHDNVNNNTNIYIPTDIDNQSNMLLSSPKSSSSSSNEDDDSSYNIKLLANITRNLNNDDQTMSLPPIQSSSSDNTLALALVQLVYLP
jgi:hypothetical protein